MSDGLLSTERVTPPMGGLAIMAAELAAARTRDHCQSGRFGGMTVYAFTRDETFVPSERRWCERYPDGPRTSIEYYRIIDRIARGEKP